MSARIKVRGGTAVQDVRRLAASEGKAWVRSEMLDLLQRTGKGRYDLSVLTLPGTAWDFERKIMRLPDMRVQRLTCVERDSDVFEASRQKVYQLRFDYPGRHIEYINCTDYEMFSMSEKNSREARIRQRSGASKGLTSSGWIGVEDIACIRSYMLAL